jgi:Tfp pilus tip-associated adhesin PilY1
MIADYTNSLVSGTTEVASFPDGSPTLADYRKADGTFGTAAVIGSGAGGKSLLALDVTSTVTDSGAVVGPTPLWTTVPGEADAGQAYAKPAVARVLIGGAEKFIAIAATGIANENPTAPFTKGRMVAAYDVATGYPLWKFQAQCAVTSDIATFETDDDLEPNAPTFNGYADRVVFADACGYVYKLDPARDLGGEWNDNTGQGGIAVESATTSHPDGSITTTDQFALFSTRLTASGLGSDSPIAGTLAIRSDSTTRVVLFFGTGGLESHPVTAANEFYAVYADTGEVRSKLAGGCAGSMCEKFYGGAVVTTQQVIFTRTTDPAIGTTVCDTGSTTAPAPTSWSTSPRAWRRRSWARCTATLARCTSPPWPATCPASAPRGRPAPAATRRRARSTRSARATSRRPPGPSAPTPR